LDLKSSYKRGYEFATYPLKAIFDNVEGPKLSLEEKNLTDSIFHAVIKLFYQRLNLSRQCRVFY
jgi:hypothetical protein